MHPRCLAGVSAAVLFAASACAADAASAAPVPAADCAICHEEVVAGFAAGAHGRAMTRRSPETFESSCEGCHGSGALHVEEPAPDNIQRWPDALACQSCHPGAATKLGLLAEGHRRHDVGCLECHESGHDARGHSALLSATPRTLCGDCHLQQRAEFGLPYAHRDGATGFDCTACHSIHADSRVGRLGLTPESNACLDCHTAQARPFVYPHPPVAHTGCVACHRPHGSPNPRLLTRNTVSLLCLECHAGVPAFHNLNSARYRDCLNCHAAVHGSNRDPRLIEE